MGLFYCLSCAQGTPGAVMPKFCSHCGESFIKTSSSPSNTPSVATVTSKIKEKKPFVLKKRIIEDSADSDNDTEDTDVYNVPSMAKLDIEIQVEKRGVKLGELRLQEPNAMPRPAEPQSSVPILEQIRAEVQSNNPIELD
jgi:hypothetical protein